MLWIPVVVAILFQSTSCTASPSFNYLNGPLFDLQTRSECSPPAGRIADQSSCEYGTYKYCNITLCYRGLNETCDEGFYKCHPNAPCISQQRFGRNPESSDNSLAVQSNVLTEVPRCSGHYGPDLRRQRKRFETYENYDLY